jgi:hypothetical protein
MSLGGEIVLISQQGVEVDHILIDQHASNTASKLLSEDLLNDTVDRITDKGLSIGRIRNIVEVNQIDLRKREERHSGINWSLRNWLLRSLSHTRLALLISIATSLAASSTSVSASVVLVASLRTTLTLLVVLLTTLGMRSLLVLRLHLGEGTEKSINELLGLFVLTLLFLLFLFLFSNPHLNANRLRSVKW